MSLLFSPSKRSYLIERPGSLAGHRVPEPLQANQLDGFVQSLRAEGAELIWEEGRGFRLFWSLSHQPIVEARQIDLVRASYELLLRHYKAKEIPPSIKESGEEIPCWH